MESIGERRALPIDAHLPSLALALETHNVVLTAEPGAGKTTRLPPYLLDAPWVRGDILVLEPRRIAARLGAGFVARERGENVGEVVGFRTRFERAVSSRTRITFLTEGILTRRIVSDPNLEGVQVVILDEFHERHLAADVALGWLRHVQRQRRADLRIVVMSATLASGPIADFLDARTFVVPGRAFPVEVQHAEAADTRPLPLQVVGGVRRALESPDHGHVLVFLPTGRDIRQAREALQPLANREGLRVVELHGSQSSEEQDRALSSTSDTKIILATNVAETSVTIEGVSSVVDTGLALVADHEGSTGLPALHLAKVSKASCIQRAGRAGRTRPGRCIRLFTVGDFSARAEHATPEIRRLDVCETMLELIAGGIEDPARFPFLEPPDPAQVAKALALLRDLGALTGTNAPLSLTAIGHEMSELPVHPRQARMIVEARRRGIANDGAMLAALIGERSIYTNPNQAYRGVPHASDPLRALDDLVRCEGLAPHSMRAAGFDFERVRAALRVGKDLARGAKNDRMPVERDLLAVVLAGYPDRVGRMRRPATSSGRSGREITFAQGGSAQISEASAVTDSDLLVGVLVEERTREGRTKPLATSLSVVDVDLLLEVCFDAITESDAIETDPKTGKTTRVRRLLLGQLVLEETRTTASEAEVARGVAALARTRGLAKHPSSDALEIVALRRALASRALGEELPPLEEADRLALLDRAASDKTSLREVDAVNLVDLYLSGLSFAQRRALDELAPTHVSLRGGRRLEVSYALDGRAEVSSRLQDFFGMSEGPKIARTVPLVLHLLAPNGRDLQVTTDLAGFWTKHYPAIARELRRRYPRHPFPDDPANATAPAPRARPAR